MAVIVEYTDRKQPLNTYPQWIVSPTRPGPCCLAHVVPIGGEEVDRQGRAFRYHRCAECGFTVKRYPTQTPPDESFVIQARLQEVVRQVA